MKETGAVKFRCEHVNVELPRFAQFDELNRVRRKLVDLGWVGIDANGVGFGNISVRDADTAQFYITGAATGGLAELTWENVAKVVAYDFAQNWIRCEGGTIASSESLTHAAVYESAPSARAVIHFHDENMWQALLHKLPTTPTDVEYGTPEMAHAVRELFARTDVSAQKIFAMGGHEGGLIALASDLRSALEMAINKAEKVKSENAEELRKNLSAPSTGSG